MSRLILPGNFSSFIQEFSAMLPPLLSDDILEDDDDDDDDKKEDCNFWDAFWDVLGTLGSFFCSFGSLTLGSFGSFSSLVRGLPFLGTLLSPRSSISMQLFGSRRDFIYK